MQNDYALQLLKNEAYRLNERIMDMNLLEEEGEKINEPERTRNIHQRKSINRAIEILENYQD